KTLRIFVFNDGLGTLNTSGLKIVDSTNATSTKFTITEPLSATIAPGAFDTFTIKFTSATAGTFLHTVMFNNNDSDENPFTFSVLETVPAATTAPEAEVRGNNVVINDGDISPSKTDFTDFGTVKSNVSVSKTFTVKNTGTKTLTTSGLKCVTTAGAASSSF